MNDHLKSCHRLLAKWCQHKASEERAKVGRCRTAYKDPVLKELTNRYADTLEASARLFEDLRADLERILREQAAKEQNDEITAQTTEDNEEHERERMRGVKG